MYWSHTYDSLLRIPSSSWDDLICNLLGLLMNSPINCKKKLIAFLDATDARQSFSRQPANTTVRLGTTVLIRCAVQNLRVISATAMIFFRVIYLRDRCIKVFYVLTDLSAMDEKRIWTWNEEIPESTLQYFREHAVRLEFTLIQPPNGFLNVLWFL